MAAHEQPGPQVRVLDLDPALGYGLADDDREAARRSVVAELDAIEPGPWELDRRALEERGYLGMLMVDGLAMRRVELASSACAELVGKGDLLRPWQDDHSYPATHFSVNWFVLEPARIVLLDHRFASAAGRWPALMDAVIERTMHRAHCLAFSLAITHLLRVEDRLQVLFRFLAERWGRVTPEGIVVPLRLTHQMLADMVGAQRPSVTTALGELRARGLVSRRADGGWTLHDEEPPQLEGMRGRVEGAM